MAAGEIRRAVVGRIPDSLRNCVNKEYFANGKPGIQFMCYYHGISLIPYLPKILEHLDFVQYLS